MTKDEYVVYLQSDHWQTTRKAALARALHRCQVCNRDKNLDVHHRTYERVGREDAADLTVLCRDCHSLFHGERNICHSRKPRKQAQAKSEIQSKVLGALNLIERDVFKTADVASLAGISRPRAGQALARLAKGGRISRIGNGRWAMPISAVDIAEFADRFNAKRL